MENYNVYEIVTGDYSLQWFFAKVDLSIKKPISLVFGGARHFKPIMENVNFAVATDMVQSKYRSVSGRPEDEIKSLGMIIAEFDGEILSSEE